MVQAALLLTSLSEAQRTQAPERLETIRPTLEKQVSQAQVALTHYIPPGTIQLWSNRYREKGLAGLPTATRSDKGKSCSLPEQAITLVEGLVLQTPPRSAAAIHRQVANKEAVAAILRSSRGNIRLIERLMMQMEHVLIANPLQGFTKEVVELTRQNLIVGLG